MELFGVCPLGQVPATTVGALKKDLDEWKKKKIDASTIESALSTPLNVIARPKKTTKGNSAETLDKLIVPKIEREF